MLGPRNFDELPIGVRITTTLTTQIVDCEIDDVKIGMMLKSVFRKIQEDGEAGLIHYGYKFKPIN